MYISIPKDFSMDIIYKDSNFFNEDDLYLEENQPAETFKNTYYWKAVDEYYLQEVFRNNK